MSSPHNPNDPNAQQSANQPWGQESANQPWSQQSADPHAGQPSWGDQGQPAAEQWGAQPQQQAGQWGGQPQQPADPWGTQPQQPTDQWGNQPGAYGGQYSQQGDPYAGQYGQQQWAGHQQPGMMSNDGKSFFSSLFDFSFQSFVTPKIIKVVYIVLTAVIGLTILLFIVSALAIGEPLPIIGSLILGPLIGLIYLALARMSLELYYAVIRLAEDVHERLPRQ